MKFAASTITTICFGLTFLSGALASGDYYGSSKPNTYYKRGEVNSNYGYGNKPTYGYSGYNPPAKAYRRDEDDIVNTVIEGIEEDK